MKGGGSMLWTMSSDTSWYILKCVVFRCLICYNKCLFQFHLVLCLLSCLHLIDSNWTEGLVRSFKVTDAVLVRFRWTDFILSCRRNIGPAHHRDWPVRVWKPVNLVKSSATFCHFCHILYVHNTSLRYLSFIGSRLLCVLYIPRNLSFHSLSN